ncbi:MAG: hypothetical protein LBP33_03500 [Candidatus Adiutrix sp.]|jgi:hypothetical protein|nr:hypothetical protein [Candidatus Adiutrix sp.]
MKIYSILALSGLALLILVVSAIYLPKAILLFSGYCFEKERYLSTQEKFDIVVAKIINEKSKRVPFTVSEAGGKIFPKRGSDYAEEHIETFRYSGLENFYKLNPNCCELVETIRIPDSDVEMLTVPLWERWCGRLNIFVRVFYIYDFDRENNNRPLYEERYFGLSNCGDLLWTPEEIFWLHY